LLQLIGQGGCGRVFLAEKEQPVRRQVALKVIKLGMDTRAVVARFEAERQALALMDHPHVAKVLDAGATETGRPFFVMDFVRGIPITRYCDQHNLDLRQCLELFIKVCHAVQHAHQKGLIHRDIKPSNVLLFSLEMPARELALRLLCSRARVNMQKLRTAHPDERMQVDLVQAANEYKGLPLVVDDNGGQNILEIRAKCRRVHARTPLDMVVIDYIQLINGLDSGLPREQQIAEVSRSIKAMAKEFKIPIIALAQLNRKSEDEARQPRMSDLRESGSIEQDADIVMLISKPPISQGKAAEAEAEQAGQDGCYSRQLIVAKNRNGPTSDINLLFNPGLTRFENPAKDYRNNE
jgi:replicative DNA helicase